MLHSDSNVDARTVEGFGEEWAAFDHSTAPESEVESLFALYFANFPWAKLDSKSEGADFGCGSGRWAKCVSPRVGHLHLIDASFKALNVARQTLRLEDNVSFHHASVENASVAPQSLDFAYSLGVLHHLPDTPRALRDVARYLKPGAPFLLYLYYALDGRPFWFKALWNLSNFGRNLISRAPFPLRKAFCLIIAAIIYWPLARTALLLEKLGQLPENFPLSFYRNLPFYFLRNDALDRFGTPLEKRFTREQIAQMLKEAGFTGTQFSEHAPYWCSVSYKVEN